MVSDLLLRLVRCPECGGQMQATPPTCICRQCGRQYQSPEGEYLDLRPAERFAEETKYLDEALHVDARHETISPPLLSARVRNDVLREFLRLTRDDVVIDLGCGSGRTLMWNRDTGARLMGADVSPFFAREARREIDLVLADLRRLPFGAGSFTKAYAVDVLEHLSRPALVRTLAEAARVLKPGGVMFVYTHVRKNSRLAAGLRWINQTARGLERLGLLDTTQERLRKSDHLNPLIDIPDLHEVSGQAGFRVVRIRYYTPLVGGFIENIVVRMAERVMTRRAERRLAAAGTESLAASTRAAREARSEAKRTIAKKGPVYLTLRALTAVMKIDVLLFGRVTSGPFFALLERADRPAPVVAADGRATDTP